MANISVRGGVSRTVGWLFPRTNMRVVRVALPLCSTAVGMRGEGTTNNRDWQVPSLADLARLENNTHVMVPWARTTRNARTESALEPVAGAAGAAAGAAAGGGAEMPSVKEGAEPAATSSASEEKLEILSKELTKLREMIAAVVTKQDSFVPMMAGGGGLAAPPPPPPLPNFGNAVGGPPPPPPPLPPPGFMLEKKSESMADLVKKNRKGQKLPGTRGPSMMDILSGIGSIKLKKGGDRPQNSDEQSDSTEPMDPAAMIAAALRKKFAHRLNSSPSAETAAWAQREKDMAERKRLEREADKPKFGLHMLKKSGKAKTRTNRAPLSSVGNNNVG